MYDEGYIKYNIDWKKAGKLPAHLLQDLNAWRAKLYQVKGIGYYEHLQVGYGNISCKHPQNATQFIISGTQTGHLAQLTPAHYALVSAYDITANYLCCKGPIKASSEALTHAAVYALSDTYTAVMHIHHKALWEALLYKVPTTHPDIPYGTPQMAEEIKRLYETDKDQSLPKIVAMAGHEEGIISFGCSLEEAFDVLWQYGSTFLLPTPKINAREMV